MGKRTSYEPGTWSWVELSTTDLDAAKAFYGGALRLGGRGQRDPRRRRHLLDEAGRRRATPRRSPASTSSSARPAFRRTGSTTSPSPAPTSRPRRRRSSAARSTPARSTSWRRGGWRWSPTPPGAMFGLWQASERDRRRGRQRPGRADLERRRDDRPRGRPGVLLGPLRLGLREDRHRPRRPRLLDRSATTAPSRPQRRPARQVHEETGVPPHLMPYFATESIEDAVAKVGELGGGTTVPVTEVPAGKFAGAIDPQGAAFMLFEGEFDE